MKDFLSFKDLNSADLNELLNLAFDLKYQTKNKIAHDDLLRGKTLGMIFAKSSTRTRVSFEVGMYQLGGHALVLNSDDIQLGRGESIEDTAKVLSRYLDGIMIRTFDHEDVKTLAKHADIPVINGLTDLQHPCQALTDLMTIREAKGYTEGLKFAYVGDGNNMANSLLHAGAMAGMHLHFACPKAYSCPPSIAEEAALLARESGGSLTLTDKPQEALEGADVVYTDTWISMGQEEEKEKRLAAFAGYTIDSDLMDLADKEAVFLHCLPAYRGYEVTGQVIDGPQSLVFDQAENRLHAQKALLLKLLK